MRKRYKFGIAAALLLCASVTVSRGDSLVRGGIGLANCATLGGELKVGGGLAHLPNALLFYWTQGYLSAANIHLLNAYNDYLDVGAVEEPAITALVVEFCKANPDKRPVNALDKFIVDGKRYRRRKVTPSTRGSIEA